LCAPIPLLFNVEALRACSHERNSKIAYMEAVVFIDAIFEFLKKEGSPRHQKARPEFLHGFRSVFEISNVVAGFS
jgi:hypothetical protein